MTRRDLYVVILQVLGTLVACYLVWRAVTWGWGWKDDVEQAINKLGRTVAVLTFTQTPAPRPTRTPVAEGAG